MFLPFVRMSTATCQHQFILVLSWDYMQFQADAMNNCIGDLFEKIYSATSIPPTITDAGIISLIGPLVKASYESKTETNAEQSLPIDEIIQSEGEKLIKQLKAKQIENDLEFFKFQRRFAIRSILHNYYECEQTDMTFRKLFNHLKPQWTSADLTMDLLKMWLIRLGFCVVMGSHNREIVIEMHSQKMARLKYIRCIQTLRQANRNIVYFREVTIHLKKHETAKEVQQQELTVFFAANHMGLLNFAFVEEDAKTKENFIEWLTIISANQPKRTVLVIEPKTFSVPVKPSIFNGITLPSAFKYERVWNSYNTFIPGPNDNTDPIFSIEMLDFSWRVKDLSIILKKFIDPTKSMEDAGFEVVHLPCIHPELSPMHRIDFVQLMNDIEEKQQCIEIIRSAIRSRLDSSTTKEWQRYFEEAVRMENDYLRFEALLSDGDPNEWEDSSSDVLFIDECGEMVELSDAEDDDNDDETE